MTSPPSFGGSAASPSPASEPGVSDTLMRELDLALTQLAAVKAEIERRVFGQAKVVEHSLAAILAGGHALLVGPPGLAKTRLVQSIAAAIGLDWSRIQFTPDLMPSDILGSEVLDEEAGGKRSFRFIKGPVFARLLMADEINRASPRTQSALLQAMAEGHVTIAGATYELPKPFHVLATQNPIEQEGTYPLPEAQLDRFLLKIDVGYPDADTERRILLETTTGADASLTAQLDPAGLLALQALVRRLPIGERLLKAVMDLVREARPEQTSLAEVKAKVSWGPSPRAGQALLMAARARALLRGRATASLDDVEALAEAVLSHRMGMKFQPGDPDVALRGLIGTLTQRAVRPVGG